MPTPDPDIAQPNKTEVGRKLQQNADLNSLSPSHEDLVDGKEENELESAKAEMGEVKEENERLKKMLEKIQENYKSLQLSFSEILQQGATKKSTSSFVSSPPVNVPEPQLVSLSLGRSTPMESLKDGKITSSIKSKDDPEIVPGLTLGLDSKSQLSSPGNSSEDQVKEDGGAETWPPSKIQKTTTRNGDEDQQNHVKRARVSVRARCDAPTMNDGCQWRKYGQKISKGNPCPRAYYRCTVAPGCPVQRCAEDTSILITTYEGNHNHPLPVSATAMASTTSAAASMLLSGSSSSQQGLNSTATTTLPPQLLNGFNFNLHENSTKQFYLPNSTSSPLFPTITLDLTSSPSSSSKYSNRFSTNFPSFPSTSLNFSSSESSMLPAVWGNGYPGYGAHVPYYQTQTGNLSLGKEPQNQIYESFSGNNLQGETCQQSLTETLAKAITSDPSFRSVIAAAISSMVCSSADQKDEKFGQNLMQAIISQDGKDQPSFSSGYFNGLASSTSQTGSSVPQPSFPFPIFNSAFKPASDDKEHKN
ncbi:hypothetical protein V6N13_043440 [Hibiscus sabdariffa]